MNPSFTPSAGDLTTTSAFSINNAGLVDQSKVPGSDAQESALDTEQEKLFDFGQARVHLDRLIQDWHTEVEDSEVRRKTRDIEVDIEGLRQKGDLDEDETLIPVRVIDTNITREQPPYINYLKNSRRICTFRSLDNPDTDPQLIEQEFARGMTYPGWETSHFKCLDGGQTHGWATIEVVFDTDKPLNVGLEYVAHDELFWPRTVKDIQDSPRMVRAYDVTITKLKSWVRDYGFDLAQVSTIVDPVKNTQKEQETRRIYKLYFKKEGVVYIAWFALTDGVKDWLKKPAKLFLGIKHKVQKTKTELQPQQQQSVDPMTGQVMVSTVNVPVEVPYEDWEDSDIKMYPIFVLPYRETEKPKVVDHKGRVFLDENKQEAQTAILSGFVNGLTRASNIYGSPSQEDGTGASLKELEDIKMCGGRMLSKPINFWSPPYPDPMVIKAMQYFDTANSEETNQVNFAAMNREDSRKTAREISAAEQQQQLLNSVQLTLFSTHIRSIYGFAWLIVQSQALQSNIIFLLKQQQRPQMMMGQQLPDPNNPAQPLMETYYENDFETIGQTWELRAAGDVDVVQRQEKIQQMMQDWPVISQTGLATRFLSDLMRLKYPDVGDQYAQIIESTSSIEQMQGMIVGMGTIMAGMVQQHPEMMQTIPPEQQQQIMQLIQQSQQMATASKQNNNTQQNAKPQ